MQCPDCHKYIADDAAVCPNCGRVFKRKRKIDILGLSILNLLIFSFVFPVILSLLFNLLNLSFLHLTLLGWLPGGVFGAYCIYRFFMYSKQGSYPLWKGLLSTVISAFMVLFFLMMFISTVFDFVHIYTNYKNAKELLNGKIEVCIADVDENRIYLGDNKDHYYYYEDGDLEEDKDVSTRIKEIKEIIEEDDDGTYYIIKG